MLRHDTSPEPRVLVLSSGGEWTDDDLGKLDGVLETWLETEAPERKDAKSQSDEDRPRLRSDPAKSTPDRMNVVIQARNFKNAWCEALGVRLAKEFPFLWQLEVGEPLGSERAGRVGRHVHRRAQEDARPGRRVASRGRAVRDRAPSRVVRAVLQVRHGDGYQTTAEAKKSEKTFLTPTGADEPVAHVDRTLPVSLVSYQDALAYCEWAGVRLPTEEEYLAAMILDDRIFPRGHPDAARLQEELFLSPRALRGTWLNFTSTTAPDGRVVCRYGPLMLRYQGIPLTDPRSRIIMAPDAFTEGSRSASASPSPGRNEDARGESSAVASLFPGGRLIRIGQEDPAPLARNG